MNAVCGSAGMDLTVTPYVPVGAGAFTGMIIPMQYTTMHAHAITIYMSFVQTYLLFIAKR